MVQVRRRYRSAVLRRRRAGERRVELPEGLDSLFVIMLVSALVPVVLAMLPGPRIAEVVVLLVAGVVVGPEVLDLAQVDAPIQLISDIGLSFLFLVAGYELDLEVVRGAEGRRAGATWGISVLAAILVVTTLDRAGLVNAPVPVAIALTTTALGTLLPILRDAGALGGGLGRAVLANGAVGEFGPIIAMSVFLTSRGQVESLLILAGFGLIALHVSRATTWFKSRRAAAIVRLGAETSSQTAVRMTVLLLVSLTLLSGELGLDVVLGAFAAGLVLRNALPEGDEKLEPKIDGIAFGFFIPVFFVVSGMQIDIRSIIESPTDMIAVFLLIVAIRGVPAYLTHRRILPVSEPVRLALYTATGLPIIVAIAQVAVATDLMEPRHAASLIGAGVLSVLIFPLLARVIEEREEARLEGPSADPAQETAEGPAP
jgi:Kef-type K+ transport system membrane component KefB